MSESRNSGEARAAPVNPPSVPSAGSVTPPGGAPFAPSTHPALAGATGGGRVTDLSGWAAAAAGQTPNR